MGESIVIDRLQAAAYVVGADRAMAETPGLIGAMANQIGALSTFIRAQDGSEMVNAYNQYQDELKKVATNISSSFPQLHQELGKMINVAGTAVGELGQIPLSEYPVMSVADETSTYTAVGIADIDGAYNNVSAISKCAEEVTESFTNAINQYKSLYSICDAYPALGERAHECAEEVRTQAQAIKEAQDKFSTTLNNYIDQVVSEEQKNNQETATKISDIKNMTSGIGDKVISLPAA